MQFDSFGEFIKYLKESRNLSASKLAVLTGNKSKTSVIRLMENKCSHKTMVKYAKTINDAIALTEEERDEMNRILKYDNVSSVHSRAMANLKFLYTDEKIRDSKKLRCVAVNSKPPEQKIYFENIFDICREKPCKIIIENVLSIELVKALHNVIHCKDDNHNPEIVQFFCNDDCIENKSIMVMCLFKLATYRNYKPYECKKESVLPKRIMILSSENDDFEMRIVSFTEDNEFYLTDTKITKEFYDHMCCNVEYRKKASACISKKGTSGEDLVESVREMCIMDEKPSVQAESALCYVMIPFDIQCRLYEDSDWLGMGREHPMVKKLFGIMKKRMDDIEKNNIPRKFIWMEEGIRKFMETGITCNHFQPVGPITPEERLVTIKRCMAKTHYQCKIMKPAYSMNDTEFHVFDERLLLINDSCHGWWGDFDTILVNDERVVRLVSDFFHNELWEKFCYSVEESREIIEGIIKEYESKK